MLRRVSRHAESCHWLCGLTRTNWHHWAKYSFRSAAAIRETLTMFDQTLLLHQTRGIRSGDRITSLAHTLGISLSGNAAKRVWNVVWNETAHSKHRSWLPRRHSPNHPVKSLEQTAPQALCQLEARSSCDASTARKHLLIPRKYPFKRNTEWIPKR